MLPFSEGGFYDLDAIKACRLMASAYKARKDVWIALNHLGIVDQWDILKYRVADSGFLGGMILQRRNFQSVYAIFLAGMSTASHGSQLVAGWNVPMSWDNVGVTNRFFRDSAVQCLENFKPDSGWDGAKVLVVGHSAGGASAELLFNSLDFKSKTDYAELLTFGAPKPFLALQAGCVPERPGYRIFCEDDPVPLMPGQGVREFTNSGVLSLLQGSSSATWCHARNGISLSAYGKWERGMLPLHSVSDEAALSRLIPIFGNGLFPNHAIVEYARRLQLVEPLPPLTFDVFIERQEQVGIPLRVQNAPTNRVIPVVMQRAKKIIQPGGLPVAQPAFMGKTLRMRRVKSGQGTSDAIWMRKNVANLEHLGGRAIVRRWNGLLKSMLRNGKWSKKNLVIAFQTFLEAASGGAPGSIVPELTAV